MSKQSFSTKTFFYSSNKKSSKFYNVTDFSSLFVRLFTGKKLKAGGKVENSCFVILQNVRDLNPSCHSGPDCYIAESWSPFPASFPIIILA